MRSRTLFIAAVAIAGLTCALEAQRGRVMPDGVARDRAMFHYRAGLENLRAEDWDKAAIAFQNAIDTDPSFEMAYYGLGRAHMGGKKFPDAVVALAKCRDLYAAHAGRRFSNLQEVQRYRRDQMMELDEILRQYQTGPQTARTGETVRQLSERKRQLQETITRDTGLTIENSVPAYVSLSLGSAYFRTGQLADAEREYKATIAADPKTGEALSNLAVVYMETGRLEEAEKAVKAAEKVGFHVSSQLKQEIKDRKKAGSYRAIELSADSARRPDGEAMS